MAAAAIVTPPPAAEPAWTPGDGPQPWFRRPKPLNWLAGRGLSPIGKLMVELIDGARQYGENPSISKMAEYLECSEQAIYDNLPAVLACGLVEAFKEPGKRTVYRMVFEYAGPRAVSGVGASTPQKTGGVPLKKLEGYSPETRHTRETRPEVSSSNPLDTSRSSIKTTSSVGQAGLFDERKKPSPEGKSQKPTPPAAQEPPRDAFMRAFRERFPHAELTTAVLNRIEGRLAGAEGDCDWLRFASYCRANWNADRAKRGDDPVLSPVALITGFANNWGLLTRPARIVPPTPPAKPWGSCPTCRSKMGLMPDGTPCSGCDLGRDLASIAARRERIKPCPTNSN